MDHSRIVTVQKRMTYKPIETREISNNEEVIFAWASVRNLLIISDGHPKWPIQSIPDISAPFEERKRLRYSTKTFNRSRSGDSNDMSWLFEPAGPCYIGERAVWEVANLTNGTPTYYITEVISTKNNDPQNLCYNAYTEFVKTHEAQSRSTLQQNAPNIKMQASSENQFDEDTEVTERGHFLTHWFGDDLSSFTRNSDYELRSLDAHLLDPSILLHQRSKNEHRLQYVLNRLRILILRSSFTPYIDSYPFYKHGVLEKQNWAVQTHWYNQGCEIYANRTTTNQR